MTQELKMMVLDGLKMEKVIEKAGFQKSNLDIDKSPDENEAQTEDVDACNME